MGRILHLSRFTLGGVMAGVFLVGVGLAALRDASDLWASALFSLALVACFVAALGGLCARGSWRGAWTGFALFGWGYLALSFGPWLETGTIAPPPLFTTVLLEAVRGALDPDAATTVPQRPNLVRRPPPRVGPPPFFQIGHSLAALGFAIVGAGLGRSLGDGREGGPS